MEYISNSSGDNNENVVDRKFHFPILFLSVCDLVYLFICLIPRKKIFWKSDVCCLLGAGRGTTCLLLKCHNLIPTNIRDLFLLAGQLFRQRPLLSWQSEQISIQNCFYLSESVFCLAFCLSIIWIFIFRNDCQSIVYSPLLGSALIFGGRRYLICFNVWFEIHLWNQVFILKFWYFNFLWRLYRI